jgi:hypothetical protein
MISLLTTFYGESVVSAAKTDAPMAGGLVKRQRIRGIRHIDDASAS